MPCTLSTLTTAQRRIFLSAAATHPGSPLTDAERHAAQVWLTRYLPVLTPETTPVDWERLQAWFEACEGHIVVSTTTT